MYLGVESESGESWSHMSEVHTSSRSQNMQVLIYYAKISALKICNNFAHLAELFVFYAETPA